jgi:hypothetical protein
MDHFRIPGDEHHTLKEWSLVVDQNLEAFSCIISAKWERGERDTYTSHGRSYPKVVVTYEDIERSSETLTADVLKLKGNFV